MWQTIGAKTAKTMKRKQTILAATSTRIVISSTAQCAKLDGAKNINANPPNVELKHGEDK
jgi:hypothetical protein